MPVQLSMSVKITQYSTGTYMGYGLDKTWRNVTASKMLARWIRKACARLLRYSLGVRYMFDSDDMEYYTKSLKHDIGTIVYTFIGTLIIVGIVLSLAL